MLSNQTRTYGIEIEFTSNGNSTSAIASALNDAGVETRYTGYTHTTTRYWKIVTDASVSGGYELVSPILKGDAGIAELKKACAVLDDLGCSANRSCGLHVHHDVRDIADAGVVNLFKSYAKSESVLDGIMPPSRRGSGASYVASIANRGLNSSRTMAGVRRTLGTRYVKLNIESFWRQGTVEFRHHSGTVDFEKISNWVFITQRMVERSIDGEFGSSNVDGMISNLFSGSVAVATSNAGFGTRGLNKFFREMFEAGYSSNERIASMARSRFPELSIELHRVVNARRKWNASNGDAAPTSSGHKFGTSGMNKFFREMFESGEENNNAILEAARNAFPDASLALRRVVNARKKWNESVAPAAAAEVNVAEGMSDVIEYFKARFAHFNPAPVSAAA